MIRSLSASPLYPPVILMRSWPWEGWAYLSLSLIEYVATPGSLKCACFTAGVVEGGQIPLDKTYPANFILRGYAAELGNSLSAYFLPFSTGWVGETGQIPPPPNLSREGSI